MRQRAFFKARYLRLTDADFAGDFHLCPPLEKAQAENLLFAFAQAAQSFADCDALQPCFLADAFIADLIADTLNISYREKLALLTNNDLQERLHLLTILLNREVEVLRLGSEIQSQVHDVMSKQQREFFLREQLKQIKEELGEGNRNPDVVSINERLAKINVPDAVREIINKEVEPLRLSLRKPSEYRCSRTNPAYIQTDSLES